MSLTTGVATALWMVAVVGTLLGMMAYSSAPGPAQAAPVTWPLESRLPRRPDRPLLVLFAHPRCPCTRASIEELARLMARFPGRIDAHVVFLRAEGTPVDWARTDLWRSAAAIPGVAVHQDEAGTEARRFHAATSGQTLVYDAGGHLGFQGGITLSRGHAGDNPGIDAISALILGAPAGSGSTPVFGCGLFETQCQESTTGCTPTR